MVMHPTEEYHTINVVVIGNAIDDTTRMLFNIFDVEFTTAKVERDGPKWTVEFRSYDMLKCQVFRETVVNVWYEKTHANRMN